jgi:hypothetical protein
VDVGAGGVAVGHFVGVAVAVGVFVGGGGSVTTGGSVGRVITLVGVAVYVGVGGGGGCDPHERRKYAPRRAATASKTRGRKQFLIVHTPFTPYNRNQHKKEKPQAISLGVGSNNHTLNQSLDY